MHHFLKLLGFDIPTVGYIKPAQCPSDQITFRRNRVGYTEFDPIPHHRSGNANVRGKDFAPRRHVLWGNVDLQHSRFTASLARTVGTIETVAMLRRLQRAKLQEQFRSELIEAIPRLFDALSETFEVVVAKTLKRVSHQNLRPRTI